MPTDNVDVLTEPCEKDIKQGVAWNGCQELAEWLHMKVYPVQQLIGCSLSYRIAVGMLQGATSVKLSHYHERLYI